MVTVAALGFCDIPTRVFIEAFNIIKEQVWIAFNVKETFLDKSDETGFSRMIQELIFSEYLDVYHMERYRHFIQDPERLVHFRNNLGYQRNMERIPATVPLRSTEVNSITDLYAMYTNEGTMLKRQLEEILALECENDEMGEPVEVLRLSKN